MRSLFEKTFGGLTRSCYIRHAFFGALVAIFLAVLVANTPRGIFGNPGFIPFLVFNTLLYPYARFVYEGVIGYIVGRNVFSGPALLMIGVKCWTIVMCWTFSLFIAPIGLAYLYWYHSRAAR